VGNYQPNFPPKKTTKHIFFEMCPGGKKQQGREVLHGKCWPKSPIRVQPSGRPYTLFPPSLCQQNHANEGKLVRGCWGKKVWWGVGAGFHKVSQPPPPPTHQQLFFVFVILLGWTVLTLPFFWPPPPICFLFVFFCRMSLRAAFTDVVWGRADEIFFFWGEKGVWWCVLWGFFGGLCEPEEVVPQRKLFLVPRGTGKPKDPRKGLDQNWVGLKAGPRNPPRGQNPQIKGRVFPPS